MLLTRSRLAHLLPAAVIVITLTAIIIVTVGRSGGQVRPTSQANPEGSGLTASQMAAAVAAARIEAAGGGSVVSGDSWPSNVTSVRAISDSADDAQQYVHSRHIPPIYDASTPVVVVQMTGSFTIGGVQARPATILTFVVDERDGQVDEFSADVDPKVAAALPNATVIYSH